MYVRHKHAGNLEPLVFRTHYRHKYQFTSLRRFWAPYNSPDLWHWQNGLGECSGFMGDTFVKNSLARKRETSPCNTLLNSPRTLNVTACANVTRRCAWKKVSNYLSDHWHHDQHEGTEEKKSWHKSNSKVFQDWLALDCGKKQTHPNVYLFATMDWQELIQALA